MSVIHEIKAPFFEPPAAVLSIDEQEVLTVEAGFWPDFGGTFVEVAAISVQLDAADRAVMLARDGEQIVLSDEPLPYGARHVAGGYQILPHVDLLAWRETDGWHIKRLIQGGEA